MKRSEFSEWCRAGVRLLDGATGTNLMRAGMPRGVCTEQWVLEHPQTILKLQRDYAAAGSEVLWVCGAGFAEGLAPDEGTAQVLQMEMEHREELS